MARSPGPRKPIASIEELEEILGTLPEIVMDQHQQALYESELVERPRMMVSPAMTDALATRDVYNIANPAQLLVMTERDSPAVFEMLQDARSRADRGAQYILHLQAENDRYRDERNLLREEARRHRHTAPRSPSATTSELPKQRSAKHPDPPYFHGDPEEYRSWLFQMHGKFEANGDIYPTEKSQVNYMISRLGLGRGGPMQAVVSACTTTDRDTVFPTLASLIEFLSLATHELG